MAKKCFKLNSNNGKGNLKRMTVALPFWAFWCLGEQICLDKGEYFKHFSLLDTFQDEDWKYGQNLPDKLHVVFVLV